MSKVGVFAVVLCLVLAAGEQGLAMRIVPSSTPLGVLNSRIIFLADQLENNLRGATKGLPAIVTTFVNVNDFSSSNAFGRVLTEALIHELQVRGWRVTEIRLARSVSMRERRGEFALTRRSDSIRQTQVRARLIVTGTYFLAGDCVVVNARVVDAASGQVLSTAQAVIPIEGVEAVFAPDLVPVVRIE